MNGFFESLKVLNLKNYSFAYIYSDFRKLYNPSLYSKSDFLSRTLAILQSRVENVIIPTFTYTREGVFNPDSTITKIGALNTFVQRLGHSYTSSHPLFSYSGLGPDSAQLLENVGNSAFGEDSVLARLLGKGCVFVHLGRPPSLGNTLVHRVEQLTRAPYRTEVEFTTKVIRHDREEPGPFSAYLRSMRDVVENLNNTNFEYASENLVDKGTYYSPYFTSDYDSIWLGDFDDIQAELTKMIVKDQSVFVSR